MELTAWSRQEWGLGSKRSIQVMANHLNEVFSNLVAGTIKGLQETGLITENLAGGSPSGVKIRRYRPAA